MSKVSLDSQIAEVKRELALRERTYPRLVSTGKMRQAEAELLVANMLAVFDTLIFLQRHEDTIRAAIAAQKAAGA